MDWTLNFCIAFDRQGVHLLGDWQPDPPEEADEQAM